MIRLYIQDFGTVCKLFITADTQNEINEQYFSIYNRKGTSGGLYLSDMTIENKQAYFIWTNKKKLIIYFYNMLENLYFLKTGNESNNGELFRRELFKQANKRLQLIPKLSIIHNKLNNVQDYKCDLDYIKFD